MHKSPVTDEKGSLIMMVRPEYPRQDFDRSHRWASLNGEWNFLADHNLIRKHIKLEDPRWLYWADRLGLLVWAEPPCVGRYSSEAITRFESQLAPMVARDGNHPCIILWGIYNEEWGLDWRCAQDGEKREAVMRAYDLLAAADHIVPR